LNYIEGLTAVDRLSGILENNREGKRVCKLTTDEK